MDTAPEQGVQTAVLARSGPTAGNAPSAKLGVFISYSREDLNFADQLEAALGLTGFATTLDRHGIAAGEDWKRRLGNLIRDADTVVFVLSPASARSEICAWEVAEAVRLGKRIIPVVCRPLDGSAPPPQLAELNFIFFFDDPHLPGSGFGTGLVQLVQALNTDLAWLREHTRLLQRATEWADGGRPTNRLLSGPDIAAAKAWAARRPKNAPPLTVLHLDFLRESEAEQSRQESQEAQRLRLMAEAQAEREVALADKEVAQKREAVQARQVVRRTLYGLVAALALAIIAGIAGTTAYLRTLEVERQKEVLAATNQRLSAEMKLRIAPFGKEAYTVSENWYKLATTNASSIAFIHYVDAGGKVRFAGTGFIVKGRTVYEPWGEDVLLVTAGHISEQVRGLSDLHVRFPALKGDVKVPIGELLWGRLEEDTSNSLGIDTAIFKLGAALPSGAKPIDNISELDITKWPKVEVKSGGQAVARSVLPEALPLIVLGATIEGVGGDISKVDRENLKASLTLSLSNALGRSLEPYFNDSKIMFTDSTTIGSSGSPVFDANDGRLVGIMQFGTVSLDKNEDGLAFSGGITLPQVREAIAKDAEKATSEGRRLPDGRADLRPKRPERGAR